MTLTLKNRLTEVIGTRKHAEQSITILKEIPPVSGNGWNIAKQVVGVKHTAKGLIIDYAYELVSPSGEVYVRMIVRFVLLCILGFCR